MNHVHSARIDPVLHRPEIVNHEENRDGAIKTTCAGVDVLIFVWLNSVFSLFESVTTTPHATTRG